MQKYLFLKRKVTYSFSIIVLISSAIISFFVISAYFSILNGKTTDSNENFNLRTSWYEDWNTTIYESSNAYGYGVAVDSEGSVYVSGYIDPAGTNNDMVLKKYNSSGVLNWTKIINGEENDLDQGYAVAVDNQDYVYLAGNIKNGSVNSEVFLAKYDKDGVLQWNTSRLWNDDYTPEVSSLDNAISIAIDTNNNIFIGVTLKNSSNNFCMGVIKFNNASDHEWNKTYHVGTDTYCWGIGVDSANNVILVGFNGTKGTMVDVQIVKYNNDGQHLWNKTRDIGQQAYGHAVAFDSDDNVTIIVEDYQNSDMVLLKYSSTGSFIYENIIDDNLNGLYYPDTYDIEIDLNTNDIYLMAPILSSSDDIKIVKCNNSGGVIWEKIWNSIYDVRAYGMCLDPLGNLYITGQLHNSSNTPSYGILLVRYSLKPAPFTVSTIDYDNPDNDGTFNLTWNPVSGADNFTIYNYTSYITEINESLNIQPNGKEIKSMSFNISGLEDGYYYYIVESHNRYGNSTSNCLSIKVVHDPSSVTLYSNHSEPFDDNGLFWLNWTNAKYADDYTIYWSTSHIYPDLVGATVLTTLPDNKTYIDISSFNNGKYYFAIRAHNIFDGNHTYTLSNNINLTLGIPPGIIMINALQYGNPDLTGEFMINWGYVKHAENYTIFWRKGLPININSGIIDNSSSDVFAVEFGIGITTLNHSITDWPEGTFYFVVFAFNLYGNSSSTNLQIDVDYPGGVTSSDGLPWWLYPIITGAISAVVGIVIKQSYSSVKKRRIFMQKVQDKFDQIDNIEAFLKEKLDYQEWQKLQEPLDKYKKRQITNKDLIKMGKKELGKDFTDIFIGKKKPKT